MHTITLAIITRKRPAMLQETLRSLACVQIPPQTKVELLVVDNDDEASARAIVERAAPSFPIPLRYLLEPRVGRGPARNAALDAAASDYLVFIDDDMFVETDWLHHLYETAVTNGASIITGQTIRHLPIDAPRWASHCRLFAPPPETISCGNLLIDRQWLARSGLRFPQQLLGEDTVFAFNARQSGSGRAICENAKAETAVPPQRLTLRWVWRRCLQNGAVRAWALIEDHKSAGIARSLALSLQMAAFAVTAGLLACIGARPWIRGFEHAGMAAGYATAALGSRRPLLADA